MSLHWILALVKMRFIIPSGGRARAGPTTHSTQAAPAQFGAGYIISAARTFEAQAECAGGFKFLGDPLIRHLFSRPRCMEPVAHRAKPAGFRSFFTDAAAANLWPTAERTQYRFGMSYVPC